MAATADEAALLDDLMSQLRDIDPAALEDPSSLRAMLMELEAIKAHQASVMAQQAAVRDSIKADHDLERFLGVADAELDPASLESTLTRLASQSFGPVAVASSNGSFVTEAQCVAQLEHLTQSLQALSTTIQQKQDDLEAATTEVDMLQQKLQHETAALKAASGSMVDEDVRLTLQHTKLTHMTQWYQQVLSVQRNLAGLDDVTVDGDTYTFLFTPKHADALLVDHPVMSDEAVRGKWTPMQYSLHVTLNDTKSITAVKLERHVAGESKESHGMLVQDVPIQDILEAVRGTSDMGFLLREIQNRVWCFVARRVHLDVLKKKYTTTYNPAKPGQLTFTIPCGVAVTISLTPDYPKKTSVIRIEKLHYVGNWPTHVFESVQDRYNAMRFSSALALADALEADLARMQPPPIPDAVLRAVAAHE